MEAVTINKEKLLEAFRVVCSNRDKQGIMNAGQLLVFVLNRAIEDEAQKNDMVYSLFDVFQPMVIEES